MPVIPKGYIITDKCCDKTRFYDSRDDFPETGLVSRLYVDRETGIVYVWDGSEYITAPSEPKYTSESLLPSTIDNGELILYNGELWRGLLEGESSLSAGTPWPVKGYKQWVAEVNLDLGAVLSTVVINNSLGNVVFTKSGAVYRASLSSAFYTNKTFVSILIGSSTNYNNDVNYSVDVGHASRVIINLLRSTVTSIITDNTTSTPIQIKIEVYPPAP